DRSRLRLPDRLPRSRRAAIIRLIVSSPNRGSSARQLMHAHPFRPSPFWTGWLALLLLAPAAGAAEVRLARHPDYHDGKFVFSYLGDLWRVSDDGASPERLTVHGARDDHPRFSPDGKWIAFSSNRYGNTDVFVLPTTGGPAKRLTYHSAADTV